MKLYFWGVEFLIREWRGDNQKQYHINGYKYSDSEVWRCVGQVHQNQEEGFDCEIWNGLWVTSLDT